MKVQDNWDQHAGCKDVCRVRMTAALHNVVMTVISRSQSTDRSVAPPRLAPAAHSAKASRVLLTHNVRCVAVAAVTHTHGATGLRLRREVRIKHGRFDGD